MVTLKNDFFMRTSFLFYLILAAGTAGAQNHRPVTELFPLKWKTQIGVTTYRTNMRLHDGLLYIGSNGVSRFELNDPLDGVYAIDPNDGRLTHAHTVAVGGNPTFVGVLLLP